MENNKNDKNDNISMIGLTRTIAVLLCINNNNILGVTEEEIQKIFDGNGSSMLITDIFNHLFILENFGLIFKSYEEGAKDVRDAKYRTTVKGNLRIQELKSWFNIEVKVVR